MTSKDHIVCLSGIHAGDNFVVRENALCNCKFVHVEHFELVVWATGQEVLVRDPAQALHTVWAFQMTADIHRAQICTLSLLCSVNTILSTLPIVWVYLPALNSLIRIRNYLGWATNEFLSFWVLSKRRESTVHHIFKIMQVALGYHWNLITLALQGYLRDCQLSFRQFTASNQDIRAKCTAVVKQLACNLAACVQLLDTNLLSSSRSIK